VIKEYFFNYKSLNSDFKIDLKDGSIEFFSEYQSNWKVSLIHTGDDSMTGGRLKRLKKYIGNETFMLTYGDGLSDVNIKELLDFHKSHGKMVTVTAVRPSARFGNLDIESGFVKSFKEKPQAEQGWINGGYFVVEPEFLDLITNDKTILEQEPLEEAARLGQLMAFKHNGYWQCMDTKRDKDSLHQIWETGSAPWAI